MGNPEMYGTKPKSFEEMEAVEAAPISAEAAKATVIDEE